MGSRLRLPKGDTDEVSYVNRSSQKCHFQGEIMHQGLSQDLETWCPKLAIVKFLGVQIFKGGNNILKFQP